MVEKPIVTPSLGDQGVFGDVEKSAVYFGTAKFCAGWMRRGICYAIPHEIFSFGGVLTSHFRNKVAPANSMDVYSHPTFF